MSANKGPAALAQAIDHTWWLAEHASSMADRVDLLHQAAAMQAQLDALSEADELAETNRVEGRILTSKTPAHVNPHD